MKNSANAPELSVITAAFKDYVQDLRNLADHAAKLGIQMAKISGEFQKPYQPIMQRFKHTCEPGKYIHETELQSTDAQNGKSHKIIPFPGTFQAAKRPLELFPQINKQVSNAPFLATPGNSLPATIPDFRSALQRDGLILLAWDKRKTGDGYRFTAYWVTSAGIPRFYSSKPYFLEEFSSARPYRKSYAAEDGIDFYGQEAPVYMVHVAPDLMKSNPRHGELRATHINMLKNHGSKVDFNYKYLLKNEKKKSLPGKKKSSYSLNPAEA